LLVLLAASAVVWILKDAGGALVVHQPIERPDTIVMLASHEWERLPAAAAQARQHPDAVVILTVPRQPTYWNCFRCGERIDWLAREGVERRRIVELHGSGNTYGEARVTATYMANTRRSRLLVVTSPYHTRRSLAVFRSVLKGTGVQLGVVGASGSNATPRRWWAYDVDRDYVAYEWTAIVWYAVRYAVSPV
jgi:uncharacterized SAM-binding protein YcdF (DUF218 family)